MGLKYRTEFEGRRESATSAAASQQTEGNPSSTPDSPAENEATPAPAVRTVDADKDTLIVGGFGEVTSFDPLTEGTNTMNIIGLCVYDKLYNMNQDGSLEMELAESVEYVGDDGMTLEIKLKSGIKFHNGDELPARWRSPRIPWRTARIPALSPWTPIP